MVKVIEGPNSPPEKAVCQCTTGGGRAGQQDTELLLRSSTFSQPCWAGLLGRGSLLCLNHPHIIEIPPLCCLAHFLVKTLSICPRPAQISAVSAAVLQSLFPVWGCALGMCWTLRACLLSLSLATWVPASLESLSSVRTGSVSVPAPPCYLGSIAAGSLAAVPSTGRGRLQHCSPQPASEAWDIPMSCAGVFIFPVRAMEMFGRHCPNTQGGQLTDWANWAASGAWSAGGDSVKKMHSAGGSEWSGEKGEILLPKH